MGKNTYTYTIQIIAPDLIGEYFNIFKPSLTPGENFNIQFSIANRRPQYINNYTMEGYHASNSPVKIYRIRSVNWGKKRKSTGSVV